MPRTKLRTPELRDEVLTASLQILRREGPARFTTRAIADAANTSQPAVYELFGDKAGLVRAIFLDGFRRLGERLARVPTGEDPRADLVALVAAYREFATADPRLAEVMFSRPFVDFDPDAAHLEAATAIRELVVARVRTCAEARVIAGDAVDVAHGLVALTQGLVAAETSGRLGGSRREVERRWALSLDAFLDGLAPA